MNVTIIADASYCPDTGAGGYGFWIACDRGKGAGDGAFRELISGSVVGEMQAILNALYIGTKKSLIQKDDKVLIQTDCQQAIDNFLEFRSSRMTIKETILVRTFYEYERHNGIVCSFRHVPGHTDGKEPRLAANNKCDRDARRNMRETRNKILAKEKSYGNLK